MNTNNEYLLIKVSELDKLSNQSELEILTSLGTILNIDSSIEDRANDAGYTQSDKEQFTTTYWTQHNIHCEGATTQHAIDHLDKVKLLEWVMYDESVDIYDQSATELLSLYEQSKTK